MIEVAPHITNEELFETFFDDVPKEITEIIDKSNEEYLYWSDVKYKKIPEGFTHKKLWSHIKASRRSGSILVWSRYGVRVTITSSMQRLCHEFDMNFGGSWGANSVIPEENKNQFLISSLMEEAISSSQIEGANTTRKKAKEMLRKQMSPKDKSQQMILNNFQTIQYIIEHKEKPFSLEMLLKIHSLMTEKTLDNKEDEGRLRTNNEVVVEDGITHETVHTPPCFDEIPLFVDELTTFFNEKNAKVFIHPIIRGVIIHFMIGYMHPFVDGNGRTARALFYWYMLKQGYWLTEYMSISRVIAKSKKRYEKSYLYTECDGNDIGYFVQYNLNVLDKAFKELQAYIKHKQEEKKKINNTFLRIGNVNERQAEIVKIFYDKPKDVVTVKELHVKFGVALTTAKNDLMGLVDLGLVEEISFNKVKKGYIKGKGFDNIVKSL